MLDHQFRQADLLGQRHDRHQPSIGDQIRIIERDIQRRSGMRCFHFAGVSSTWL
jgi:hypothetical protein